MSGLGQGRYPRERPLEGVVSNLTFIHGIVCHDHIRHIGESWVCCEFFDCRGIGDWIPSVGDLNCESSNVYIGIGVGNISVVVQTGHHIFDGILGSDDLDCLGTTRIGGRTAFDSLEAPSSGALDLGNGPVTHGD